MSEIFLDMLSKRLGVFVHFHKEDDAILLIQLAKKFDLKTMAHHCMGIYREEVFIYLHSIDIPVVYGPLDSFQYKVELKNESWRNVKPLIDSKVKLH